MKTTTLKKTISAGLAGLMLILTGCGAAEPAAQKSTTPTGQNKNMTVKPLSAAVLETADYQPDESFSNNYCNFAAELFKESCTESIKNGENVMISPESVMFAFGMAANGAQGDTLKQIEDTLGGTPLDELNNALQYHTNKLEMNTSVDFNVANSVWVRDDADCIQIKQDFCDKLKKTYDADTYLEPFDINTRDNINAWVSKNTNNMIPMIIDEIPEDSVSYIINAIAFEGKWDAEYEDDQIKENKKFKNSKGKREKVTMLYSEEHTYFEDEDVTGFLKYYDNREYAFMAMLPKKGTKLADFVSNLDGEKIKHYQNTYGDKVNVCIPEFSFDYDNELSDDLKAMGMELPFSPNADFSAMADTGTGGLYIDRVLHKTHVELDRYGTKASAATAAEDMVLGIEKPEKPKTVYLDRPFAFAIIDTQNGMPIFIGAVNTVNGQ